MSAPQLIVFGLGYTGAAVAGAARDAGWRVAGTVRGAAPALPGIEVLPFGAAGPALDAATHLLATAPPDAEGDPVLARYRAAILAAPLLRWLGYYSTTGVYGDHGGGRVDEDTPVRPDSERARRRVAAEQGWAAAGAGRRVDVLRLAGIYGPGRSVFDGLRAGRARRVVKPGHRFGRVHRDDIVQATLAAMRQERPSGTRVLNLADDEPAESARVIEEAARLLGTAPPPAIPYEEAVAAMGPMARSFWAENRTVASRAPAALDIAWRYPTYREGLRAILVEECGEGAA